MRLIAAESAERLAEVGDDELVAAALASLEPFADPATGQVRETGAPTGRRRLPSSPATRAVCADPAWAPDLALGTRNCGCPVYFRVPGCSVDMTDATSLTVDTSRYVSRAW